jgi:hypothetical protein
LEVKDFMVELVERWIGDDMRDFNMLGYVCKFMMFYLGESGGIKGGIRGEETGILLRFFRELKYETLIQLNTIFY